MNNAFILCDLLWNVQKSYENREGSFKTEESMNIKLLDLCESLIIYILLSTCQWAHMTFAVKHAWCEKIDQHRGSFRDSIVMRNVYKINLVQYNKSLWKWCTMTNFHKMCLVYKCRNWLVRQYLTETFSNVSDKHEHHTRAQTRQYLTLVKPKNNQLKRSFKYSCALNWNNLNPVIRNATSLNIFKSAYLKSHFNN